MTWNLNISKNFNKIYITCTLKFGSLIYDIDQITFNTVWKLFQSNDNACNLKYSNDTQYRDKVLIKHNLKPFKKYVFLSSYS